MISRSLLYAKVLIQLVGVIAIVFGIYSLSHRVYKDYRDFDAMRSWVIRHALAEQAAQRVQPATSLDSSSRP
jgi:hypothetical protein